MRKLLQLLKDPPAWLILLALLLTAASITGAMLMLTVDYEGTALAYLAYALFSLAAVTLGYTVYILILFIPQAKTRLGIWLGRHALIEHLVRDFGFRTVVITVGSFALSIVYGVFNGVLGILSLSVWYGVLATYYILLALMRGGVLLYHRRKDKRGETSPTKTYRTCGILLVVLSLAFSVAVAQMVLIERAFVYAGLMIYASAAYAFYKITMSVINLLRAHRQSDLIVQAIRDINLTDATVSILALQTALLSTFGDGGGIAPLFNAITGTVVCLFNLGLGTFMICRAGRILKSEKCHHNG